MTLFAFILHYTLKYDYFEYINAIPATKKEQFDIDGTLFSKWLVDNNWESTISKLDGKVMWFNGSDGSDIMISTEMLHDKFVQQSK